MQAVESAVWVRLSNVFSVNAVSSDMMIQSNDGSTRLAGQSRNHERAMMPPSSASISSPSYCFSCSKNDVGRCARFSDVEPLVITRPAFGATSFRTKSLGFGVVVHTTCGLGPRRKPIMAMSQVSSPFVHAANSSHQRRDACGPRSRSGSSAENPRIVAGFPLSVSIVIIRLVLL